MKYRLTKPQTQGQVGSAGADQTTVSFGNSNVTAIVNTTPPRKPHNLFFRNSLIFLFFIVAITLLSGCPGPAGPKGAQGDRGEKGDTGDSATSPALRECHNTLGYPTACYNAATDILTITGIDLADVGASGPGDDIDMNRISIAGRGGTPGALSLSALSVAPTIAKVDDSEFTLTLNSADKTEILKRLDRNGTVAYDSTNFFIALGDNWNGSSSLSASMPVRTTNIPSGYCGDFSSENTNRRPTIDGTANTFFGGGTGTSADPYSITMRPHCDELTFDWNSNYPAVSGTTHTIHYNITFSTSETYSLTLRYFDVPTEDILHTVFSTDLLICREAPTLISPANTAMGATVDFTYIRDITAPLVAAVQHRGTSGKPLGGSRRLSISVTEDEASAPVCN